MSDQLLSNNLSKKYPQGNGKNPFVFLLVTCLVVVLVGLSAKMLWQYTKQQQLIDLNNSAQSNIELYSNKVQKSLGETQLSLLPVIAEHPSLQNFLTSPKIITKNIAQQYLTNLLAAMPNRSVFIGSASQLLLSSHEQKIDLEMLAGVRKTIVTRAYKGINTEQFVFSSTGVLAKFLVVTPIKTQQQVIGFIGLLIDLSTLQDELSNQAFYNDEIILVSDVRGIIMLSSEPSWLYRSFSNLPYSLKKSLFADFEQQHLFSQLGIVNIDEGILTTQSSSNEASSESENKQSFIVHSSLLTNQPLRIHHLANIAPVIQQSNFTVMLFLLGFLLLSLSVILFQAKKRAQFSKLILKRALDERELAFKQQQKLASLGMMATTIAHEINQPITAIKTEAMIGKKQLAQNKPFEAEQSFLTIVEYTNLLATITSQLKGFAKKRHKIKAVGANVHDAIKQSFQLNQQRMKSEGIEYDIANIDQKICAEIDTYQLQQVLSNLIQNACDAMQDQAKKTIKFKVFCHEKTVVIHCSDTGEGIAEELQTRIFDPFISSKTTVSSMGLGLAICHDIVTRTGGNIELLLEPDIRPPSKGAVFKITLPRFINKAEQVELTDSAVPKNKAVPRNKV